VILWTQSRNFMDKTFSCHYSLLNTRRLPTSAAHFRFRFKSCVIWGGQSAMRHGFAKLFESPCNTFIPLIAPKSSPSVIQGWYNRPINGRSNSPLGSTTAPEINERESLTQGSDTLWYFRWSEESTFVKCLRPPSRL
jgi:hypothetical protein